MPMEWGEASWTDRRGRGAIPVLGREILDPLLHHPGQGDCPHSDSSDNIRSSTKTYKCNNET